MEKRVSLFLILAAAILIGSQFLNAWLFPRPPAPPADQQVAAEAEPKKPDAAGPEKPQGPDPAQVQKPPEPAPPAVAAEGEIKPAWTTLGSLDETGPFRMLVTLGNRGAAVERVELNNPRYHYVDHLRPLGGYLGHLIATDPKEGGGAVVHVVGPGTPAAKAGLQADDVIREIDGAAVPDTAAFDKLMRETKPGRKIKLGITRDGKPQTLEATLRQHPLAVVHREAFDRAKPEVQDPASFLVTLDALDDKKLDIDDAKELDGVKLRDAYWELLPPDPANPNTAAFRRTLAAQQIEIVKRYTLMARDQAAKNDNAAAYTLVLRVEVKNTGAEKRKVGYRLEGPTGLPVEGYWYARNSKIGAESGIGMRDVVHGRVVDGTVEHGMTSCTAIAKGEAPVIAESPISYIGADSQYFAAIVMPQGVDPGEARFPRIKPVAVGPPPDPANLPLTNVSFRMARRAVDAEPGATAIADEFKIFLGPKNPEILAEYALDPMVDYGWYDWIAKPMLAILHFFYSIVGNYGIAIILLTVVVRSAMFPLSRKQALNAIKMQELQPEIKRIAEKYKADPQQRMKAQQELFRKHNYNPFSGCLPIFIQLPIFVGLYNSLRVDVELRQAPLLTDNIRWASDLSAPDMLINWRGLFPFLTGEDGWLGPFLNLLPLVTIVLFLVQQKMFMPPPTDEQSAMQQKMMKYMMIFMGFMFFKVPAGLCVYFITSSIWSIVERLVLPKAKPAEPMSQAVLNVDPRPNGGGDRKGKRR
jgi:YidC/Oxa1 family membrane protein insertase